eukprot:TRINITY_DN867_c3_g1_i4.p1 TRINITY_DN867_c3_g1~~TRINITY_DN867_c3_g1_i4.p1  ORF type:complete len:117 (+),score=2.67 TRINITY_DN867_c3_g1_i4:275-625(+)
MKTGGCVAQKRERKKGKKNRQILYIQCGYKRGFFINLFSFLEKKREKKTVFPLTDVERTEETRGNVAEIISSHGGVKFNTTFETVAFYYWFTFLSFLLVSYSLRHSLLLTVFAIGS